MAYLDIKNIYKNFGNVEVLKGIDLAVEKGEVVSIIGSSGSGKTTLLRCINFLETPDSGEMVLDGQTLIDNSTKKDNEKVLREKKTDINVSIKSRTYNISSSLAITASSQRCP